ncbi:hypothetical protein Vretifemale_6559, partial [Volvox reticuliferus]
DLFIMNGEPQAMSSLTYVFKSTSCGVLPKLNASIVQNYIYASDNSAPVVATIQRYYESCSYRRLTLNPADNLVFDIDIPCIGHISNGGLYNMYTGNGIRNNTAITGVDDDFINVDITNELMALRELGMNYLRVNAPDVFARVGSFRRTIIVWPFNWLYNIAQWSGLANMGCISSQYCVSWLNLGVMENAINIPVLFQELNHNIGLPHSSRVRCDKDGFCFRDEYGDWSDPMGNPRLKSPTTGVLCVNAPQAYKAGWASPIPGGNIRASDLPVGIFRDFFLPAMALNSTNMLRIITMPAGTVGSNSALERALYVSYRVRQSAPGAYDSGLVDDFSSRVWIHEYNETANGQAADITKPPMSLAMLTDDAVLNSNNGQYNQPTVRDYGALPRTYSQFLPGRGGIIITVKRKNSQVAVVSVCRATSLNETGFCSDGIDNDCDGLLDGAEPECTPASPPRSPPSPRPPPSARRSPSPPRQPKAADKLKTRNPARTRNKPYPSPVRPPKKDRPSKSR